jgi:pyrophosphatase PpaX
MCELGHRCAIATTRTTDSAIDTLRATGLLEFLDPIVGVDQVSAPKPAPDTLLTVLDATGCAPRDALMIGDTEADVHAAVSAKVRCWAVLGGHGAETALRDAGAERILGTGIGELLGALQTYRHTTIRHRTGDRPE